MSGSDSHGERGGGKRFRRPRFDAPRAEEGEERLPAVPRDRDLRELGMFVEPLSNLAEAFRQNTEALQSLAEGQTRIGKRLERSDRSEAVIHSTQALNETFRGVQKTQERLMTRLEGEKKRPWLLLVGGVVAVGAVLGGLLWFLLGWVDEREETVGNPGVEALRAELQGRDLTIDELRDDLREREKRTEKLMHELSGKAEEIVRQEGLTREQVLIVEQLKSGLAELEEEKRGFRETQSRLARLLSENAGLNTEASRLTDENERLRRQLSQARQEASEKDARVVELERELKDLIRREAGAPAAEAAPQPIRGTPEERAAPSGSGVPAGAVTDVAEMERLANVLNRLLAGSKGAGTYEFVEMKGVRGKRLYQVVLVYRDDGGREAKRIEAGECRVAYDESLRRAEISFWNGYLTYYGVRAPFLGNRHVVFVNNIDPVAWRRSGLLIIEPTR